MDRDKVKLYVVDCLTLQPQLCQVLKEGQPVQKLIEAKLESVRLHMVYWCLLSLSVLDKEPLKRVVNDIQCPCAEETGELRRFNWMHCVEGETNVDKLTNWILCCQNKDFGFGPSPRVHSQLTATSVSLTSAFPLRTTLAVCFACIGAPWRSSPHRK
eukprot:Gregarina_sp_Poly_1__3375@NODE_1974_length_2949_cov_72_921582_g1272_i0_p3_GENE_NODE_1974_length_2949_cov_72_921582_g1272_i0NODE_1974_length_2949_cov_72_921582_g1272_i0_p3_ORF_typecomplete_len157_score12_02Prenyltrans/PF00432_21/12Prenyltrans/PF00432_21/2_6e05_NODE_1974_length_2949_cov_72_921582_g1272_i021882658